MTHMRIIAPECHSKCTKMQLIRKTLSTTLQVLRFYGQAYSCEVAFNAIRRSRITVLDNKGLLKGQLAFVEN